MVQEFLRHPDRAHQVVVDGRAFVRDGRLVLADAASPSPPAAASAAGGREVSVRLTAPVAAAVRRARDPVTRSELRMIGELIGRHDTASTAADQRDLRAAVVPRMRALAETTTPLGADLVLDADITVLATSSSRQPTRRQPGGGPSC